MNFESNPPKEIVTVSEMARNVGLSRSRFYQLISQGIFPAPSRNPQTNRPFYDRARQELCLMVKRTNCGLNGRAILFYGRPAPAPPRLPNKKVRTTSNAASMQEGNDGIAIELTKALEQLSLPDVTVDRVRTALVELYPDGYASEDSNHLLMAVFRRLRCQVDG